MLAKLKSFLADDALFYSVLLVLVAGASFGLGRLSANDTKGENSVEKQQKIETFAPAPQIGTSTSVSEVRVAPADEVSAVEVVGSKSGSKYHLPDCPGAKRIKSENLVQFASIAAAEAAGYTPAANCPGLK